MHEESGVQVVGRVQEGGMHEEARVKWWVRGASEDSVSEEGGMSEKGDMQRTKRQSAEKRDQYVRHTFATPHHITAHSLAHYHKQSLAHGPYSVVDAKGLSLKGQDHCLHSHEDQKVGHSLRKTGS